MDKKKLELNKEKVKQMVDKVDVTMDVLNKEADSKLISKMKGLEAPIIITIGIMLLIGSSVGMLLMGAIVLAATTSPKWLPSMLQKLDKKNKDVVVVTAEDSKEEVKVDASVESTEK